MSRNLDALVAKKVMGWHRRKSFWATAEKWDVEIVPGDWSPSTDIAAAWQVVDKLNERYRWYLARGFDCYAVVVYDLHDDNAIVAEEKTDTAPLAICLAALKAVKRKAP